MSAPLGSALYRISVAALLVMVAGGLAASCDAAAASSERAGDLAAAASCGEVSADGAHEDEASELLDRWAPTFVQHVARGDAGRDRPTRVDFDGDWDATNNWDNQARFRHDLPPAVYGAAVLTETHAYLTYTLYYPRDWIWPICLPYICHDNDLESLLVVVERGGGLVLVETKAHLHYHEHKADQVATDDAGRPLIAVEARGHGPRACGPGDDACTPGPGTLVYVRGDSPSSPPREADGREVRYELISLRHTLWARRHLTESPRGLWIAGETGPVHYAGKRCGRMGEAMGASMAYRRYPGGVRPPWALKGPEGARGDWFLDPAAVNVARYPALAASGPGALNYVFHPYLKDLAHECVGDDCAPRVPPPEPSRVQTWAGMGVVAGLLVFALQRSLARRSRLSEAPPSVAHRRGR